MYCLNMLSIALELARHNRAYEDVASKFFEHFVYICRAMNNIGGEKIELWMGFFMTSCTFRTDRPVRSRSDLWSA